MKTYQRYYFCMLNGVDILTSKELWYSFVFIMNISQERGGGHEVVKL